METKQEGLEDDVAFQIWIIFRYKMTISWELSVMW